MMSGVAKNSNKFFDREQFNNRYMFLDFGLVGIHNADAGFYLEVRHFFISKRRCFALLHEAFSNINVS